jgi:hypothetical protein
MVDDDEAPLICDKDIPASPAVDRGAFAATGSRFKRQVMTSLKSESCFAQAGVESVRVKQSHGQTRTWVIEPTVRRSVITFM